MECECFTSECECITCNNFKVPININTEKMVKKIAEMLGLSSIEVIEIKCEREDVSWSDYCIRCHLVVA